MYSRLLCISTSSRRGHSTSPSTTTAAAAAYQKWKCDEAQRLSYSSSTHRVTVYNEGATGRASGAEPCLFSGSNRIGWTEKLQKKFGKRQYLLCIISFPSAFTKPWSKSKSHRVVFKFSIYSSFHCKKC